MQRGADRRLRPAFTPYCEVHYTVQCPVDFCTIICLCDRIQYPTKGRTPSDKAVDEAVISATNLPPGVNLRSAGVSWLMACIMFSTRYLP
jgi:hypothetical protein